MPPGVGGRASACWGRPAVVPTDPEVLLAGLLAGTVTRNDYDRTNADQVSALACAAAPLITRTGVGRAR